MVVSNLINTAVLASTDGETEFSYQVTKVFDALFLAEFNTRLIGGGSEPIYQPAGEGRSYHQIVFTRDYGASALHEVAHWCIAGPARLGQIDYGYWYEPDGRSDEQQTLFETVEVKPQAIEWVFARAAGKRFRVSADNLMAASGPSLAFKKRIWRQTQGFCQTGLPTRAARFAQALALHFGGLDYLAAESYRLEDLM